MQYFNKLLIFTIKSTQRQISTSAALAGKKNFRKFLLYNKRGTRSSKAAQQSLAKPLLPVHKRGVRDTGITVGGKYVEIPEKVPELIVPNLDDCKLKPYVSYRTPDVVQSEFTSLDLYNAVYAQKVIDDYKSDKLLPDGSSTEPSEIEQLTPEEAFIRARKTGSDIF